MRTFKRTRRPRNTTQVSVSVHQRGGARWRVVRRCDSATMRRAMTDVHPQRAWVAWVGQREGTEEGMRRDRAGQSRWWRCRLCPERGRGAGGRREGEGPHSAATRLAQWGDYPASAHLQLPGSHTQETHRRRSWSRMVRRFTPRTQWLSRLQGPDIFADLGAILAAREKRRSTSVGRRHPVAAFPCNCAELQVAALQYCLSCGP